MTELFRNFRESVELFLFLMAGSFFLLFGLLIVVVAAWLELRKWKRTKVRIDGLGNRK